MRIESPVLVPFGHNINIIAELSQKNKRIYVYPLYKYWGECVEMIIKKKPTEYTLNYIKEKINNDFSGVITRSKYYGLFHSLFNDETANTIDKLYQISLDKDHKKVLGFLITVHFEAIADDAEDFKKIDFSLYNLNKMFDNIGVLIDLVFVDNIEVYFVKEDLINQKFSTIYDSIYRKSRLYTPQYLGFVGLFFGEKEITTTWDARLKHIARFNLVHGGQLILQNIPREYEDRVKKIMSNLKYKKTFKKNIWTKPDIKTKKIRKGITKYM